MTNNFWGYLIGGLGQIVMTVLERLPPGALNSAIGNAATALYVGVAPILFFVGTFMNLRMLAGVIVLIGSLEAVKVILSVYRWILKLIPAAG